MNGLPAGTRVWLAAGATDMRKGFDGFVTVTYGARIESQGSPGVMPPRRRLATLR
jgi:transposase